MGSITIPARPGETLAHASAAVRLFFRIIAALEWFWDQEIPAPLALLLMVLAALLFRAGSPRNYVHFWRQFWLFTAGLVIQGPRVIGDLFFSNAFVDTPFPLWIVVFWRGFAVGIVGSLCGLFGVTRQRRRRETGPIPPPSPPPTPPAPFAPPPPARDLRAYIVDGDEEDDMVDALHRRAYNTDVRRRQDWERRRDQAVGTAREYRRARRAHEERAAEREWRERERGEDGYEYEDIPGTTQDRTGRDPRTLRAEFGYWWPWVRVSLVVLALVGIALGIVYYCENLEAGEDCGWVTQTLCGGPGVGLFDCLGDDEWPIDQASVPGPVRFRFMSDGSRVRILDP
ncbi:hypothetical protein F4801DRAFT_492984 [Xylaria longipes]|nr:hypothetical protein F4801DRAFT_492984 [Xylaria longipes]